MFRNDVLSHWFSLIHINNVSSTDVLQEVSTSHTSYTRSYYWQLQDSHLQAESVVLSLGALFVLLCLWQQHCCNNGVPKRKAKKWSWWLSCKKILKFILLFPKKGIVFIISSVFILLSEFKKVILVVLESHFDPYNLYLRNFSLGWVSRRESR